MSIVSVSGLTYEYPQTRALSDVSFTLEEGSITALVGPNGAGKSTLMRCMAALDTPLSGTVLVDGLNAADHPRDIHRKMGYLPDLFGVYDQLTVTQTLRYFADANGVAAGAIDAAVQRVIALTNLSAYASAKAANLSRGWRQRLVIAQTLVHQPNILLLDEPASGLDPEARHALSQLLLQLKSEGVCVLVSSHILSELEDYCDRMLILRGGVLVDDTTASTDANAKQSLVRVTLTEVTPEHVKALEAIAGITLREQTGNQLLLQLDHAHITSPQALQQLSAAGLPVSAFTPEHESLQHRYLAQANTPIGNG